MLQLAECITRITHGLSSWINGKDTIPKWILLQHSSLQSIYDSVFKRNLSFRFQHLKKKMFTQCGYVKLWTYLATQINLSKYLNFLGFMSFWVTFLILKSTIFLYTKTNFFSLGLNLMKVLSSWRWSSWVYCSLHVFVYVCVHWHKLSRKYFICARTSLFIVCLKWERRQQHH